MRLQCIDCHLETIEDLAGLSHLEFLDASGNSLDHIEEVMEVLNELAAMKQVSFIGNPIYYDASYLPKLIEATVDHQLEMIDFRTVYDIDYDAVLRALDPNSINGTTELVETSYKARIDTIKYKIPEKSATNDPAISDLLDDSIIDLNHRMFSLIGYIKDVTTSPD
jgi:hypothetical protein